MNRLATNVFNVRLAQANLITKTDFDAKLSSLNRKITQNKSKHLLVQNEFKKLKAFDSSYFIGKSLSFFFFPSGFSFTDTDDSQDSRGREGTIFYSTLPLPPAHEH